MTVAELMTELAKWPPDLEVHVQRSRWGDLYEDPVEEVHRIDEGLLIR